MSNNHLSVFLFITPLKWPKAIFIQNKNKDVFKINYRMNLII